MPTNTDIAAERANSNINARDLTFTLYGEDGAYRRKLAFERADKDQAFEKSKKFSLMDRDKLYDEAIRMETVVAQRLQEYGYNNSKDIQTFLDRGYFLSAVFLGVHPFAIHFGGFIPSILGQGTPEQIQEFLPKAECMEYIGTYCQTELSHGSFVRGLETTATYDKSTEEFILHTPNLSAIKFWPGGLGRSCNYAVLMAQLVITGKNYGIHPFMCQLRDLNTHQPLPGVEVGDINYKFGGNALDNGYLILTHYRIPRTHLLMKYAQVSPDGTYTRQDVPPQIAYLSMTFLRTILVTASASSLAKAATIATRYSAVRRQTANRDGIEPQILDYQTQQMKLFPAICTAYALHFSGAALQSAYNDILASVGNGDMSRLSELHCLTSGLKAYSADISSHHIEVCRRSCGGHGYSHASGIPDIYQQNVINCTVEGESTVLYLQVGRSLVKFLKKADSGEKLPPALAFLSESSPPTAKLTLRTESTLDFCVSVFKYNIVQLSRAVTHQIAQSLSTNSVNLEAALALHSLELVKTAQAFAQYLTVLMFVDGVKGSKLNPKEKLCMLHMCEFYAIHNIVEESGQFLKNEALNAEQLSQLCQHRTFLLTKLRPNAVALVDAFDYPDRLLNSCLGRYDGNVYEALYEYAKDSTLNQHQVHPSYHKYIKPMQQAIRAKL